MDNTEFNNVTVVKKANVYFDGKVTSRNIFFTDGSRKTLGIMLPGEYEFGTGDPEIMEILQGEVDVLLPTSNTWEFFQSGQSFEIPADSKFRIKLSNPVDYCCSYGN